MWNVLAYYVQLDNAKRDIPSQGAKVDFEIWPSDPKSIGWTPPLIMNNLHVKFESDRAKTVVCIVPTRSYTHECMTLIFDPINQNH